MGRLTFRFPLPNLVLLLLLICAVRAAEVRTDSIPSAAMGKSIPVSIILPEVYRHSDSTFPVLYLLHGHGGSHRSWIDGTDVESLADLHRIIIVCPDGGINSWYLDSVEDPASRYETHVAGEVVSFIDAHYRTIADRRHRAITGLSMGGFGALHLATNHLEVFGGAGSISGGVDLRPFPNNWEIAEKLGSLADNPERWNDLALADHPVRFGHADLRLMVDCGTDDFFIGVNRSLHQALLEAGIDHTYLERPGVHNWDYWREAIRWQADFFAVWFYQFTDVTR